MRENLIPFPYSESSKVSGEITWTVNADGSVTADGTASADKDNSITIMNTTKNIVLPIGKYLALGCPINGSPSTYRLRVGKGANNAYLAQDLGEGTQFESDGVNLITIQLIVMKGTKVSNLVFRPKIIKVFDYTQPKTDWTAEDYFNTTDYERIVGNIIETQDFASSLYSGYDIAEMMENVNYESVPHADTWNVISENIGIINQHTYNLPLEPSRVYVENGYAPNYEEFNRWESSIERLMTTLRVEASTIPRLAIICGRKALGIRL